MDAREEWHIRLRLSLRVATGAAIVSTLALATPLTSGCTTSVLFLITSLAGTPHNHQGFQIHSANLTFLGALLGAIAYIVVALVSGTSKIGSFFSAAPFIVFFSALRADARLTPLPPVANVYLGFLVISRLDDPRSEVIRNALALLLEAFVAWAVAMFINLVLFPDRAGDLGRRIVAEELQTVGKIISNTGTNTFSNHPYSKLQSFPNDSFSRRFDSFIDKGLLENAISADLFRNYVFQAPNFHRLQGQPTATTGRTPQMLRAAYDTLHYLHDLRPFGSTVTPSYKQLARARQLFAASQFEPRIFPEAVSRWRNPHLWQLVLDRVESLVNKASCLESVSCGTDGSRRFSPAAVRDFFGEAYFPLWMSHFAGCAAACAVMSHNMHHSTCHHMFELPSLDPNAVTLSPSQRALHATIDPRKWRARRWEMAFGILMRYRNGVRNTTLEPRLLPEAWHDVVAGMNRRDLDKYSHPRESDNRQAAITMSERQALAFFAIASQAMSEEISFVQASMTKLADSVHHKTVFDRCQFLLGGFVALGRRVRKLVIGRVEAWEVRFVFTHSLLLLFILALALFLPLRETIEAAELAWIFTSAALAAQLSAEPTLFIGTIRVAGSITGAVLSYGFNSFLNAIGRSDNPSLQYAVVPYIFFVTIVFVMSAKPWLRYAAFLVVVTNSVLVFCPRATEECSVVLAQQTESCIPDGPYFISRGANVSIGVIFAVIFHIVFWPRIALHEALRELSCAFKNSARVFRKIHATYFAFGVDHRMKERLTTWGNQTLESHSEENSLLRNDTIYARDTNILSSVHKQVGRYVSKAILLVNVEANVWRVGPLRLPHLVESLLPDFISLKVSLSELAMILGRRPIFSGEYGRSAYEYYIEPVLALYENLQVSLQNMVGVTNQTLFTKRKEAVLRDISLDLHMAIAHLSRCRYSLYQDAKSRCFKLGNMKDSNGAGHRRRNSSRFESGWQRDVAKQLSVREAHWTQQLSQPDNVAEDDTIYHFRGLKRSLSAGSKADLHSWALSDVCVDDLILYNAFTFVADGCLSAFVRIAVRVLADGEQKLVRRKNGNKKL